MITDTFFFSSMLRFSTKGIYGKKPHPKKGNWLLRLGLAEGVGMVMVTITFYHKKWNWRWPLMWLRQLDCRCENGGEFYWAEGRWLWVSVQWQW